MWIDKNTGEIVYDPSKAVNAPNEDLDVSQLFIETTVADIEEANGLLKNVLIRKSDELTGGVRAYL